MIDKSVLYGRPVLWGENTPFWVTFFCCLVFFQSSSPYSRPPALPLPILSPRLLGGPPRRTSSGSSYLFPPLTDSSCLCRSSFGSSEVRPVTLLLRMLAIRLPS